MAATTRGRCLPCLACLALAGLFLLASACGPPEPVYIGFLGGISGRVADLGMAGRDGVQMAVDRCNQSGGVNGRKVVLLVKDDHQEVTTARREAKELIDQGVAAIIGPMTSDMAVAVAPVLAEAKVVAVSPTATTEALSGKDDYFFRVTGTTRTFATASAEHQLATKAMSRVAAAFDLGNRSFSESWLDQFVEVFTKGGGEVVAKVGFKSAGNTSYSGIARDLLAADPDGVLLVANAVDSSLICQQIRRMSPHMPITMADWAAQERLIELGGKAVEGVTLVQTFNRDNQSPRYQEFRREYMKRFGREPGFAGVYAFDAAKLVLDALAGMKEGETLKQAILAGKGFEGLQGHRAITEYGDVVKSPCSIIMVRDAKFVVVK